MFKVIFAVFFAIASISRFSDASPVRRRYSASQNSISAEEYAESMMQGFVQASQMIAALVKAYGLGIRLDVMAYAVGFRFIIDQVDDSEKEERHVIAKTVMKMWHQLSTVEAVDEIFLNVTVALVRGNIDSKNFLNETLLYLFLEQELRQNDETRGEYTRLKSKIAALPAAAAAADDEYAGASKINFSGPEGLDRILEFSFAKRCMLNWYFVTSSRPHEITKTNDTYRERYLLARSMLTLARQRTHLDDELQRIYDRSLNEAIAVVEDLPRDFEKGLRYLFETIEEKVTANTDLRVKLREVSQRLRAEENPLYLPDSEFILLPPMR